MVTQKLTDSLDIIKRKMEGGLRDEVPLFCFTSQQFISTHRNRRAKFRVLTLKNGFRFALRNVYSIFAEKTETFYL